MRRCVIRSMSAALSTVLCLMVLVAGAIPGNASDVAGLRWSIVKVPECPPRSCWQVKVTARSTSCPHGLYVAVNQWTEADLQSPSNTFIVDVSTIIPHLRKGDSVVVTFPRAARRAEGVSLSEINCY